jgi:MYXO-CTERM domain-containing protein
MTFKFLKIMGIGFIVSVKKLLPILFLFTGFQANAVVIGNLTYDGTYISGDGRTYVGLDTIAAWDYATTLAATTEVDGPYEGFRIANTADADFFIGSLFGANADSCSTVDGSPTNGYCGEIQGWTDGLLGDNHSDLRDIFMFIADEFSNTKIGLAWIDSVTGFYQYEKIIYSECDEATKVRGRYPICAPITWLLVKDTVASAPGPSSIALMGLGIFGLGFARRRRQS